MAADTTKTRKLKVAYYAMTLLFLGLSASLLVAWKGTGVTAIVIAVYSQFVAGLAGVTGIFTHGNIKEHQAASAALAEATPAAS